MGLTERQRQQLESWVAANMDGTRSATWAANQLAPLLGLGEPPLGWDVLHPLAAEVRRACKRAGLKPGGGARRGVALYPKTCAGCGRAFETIAPNARYCPACRRKRYG